MSAQTVVAAGTATDPEDGDISSAIVWTLYNLSIGGDPTVVGTDASIQFTVPGSRPWGVDAQVIDRGGTTVLIYAS